MGAIRMAYRLAKSFWRRAGLFVFATGYAVLSVSFYELRGQESYLPYLWPIWFMVTAILITAFAIRPKSTKLYQLSGAFGITALASRPASVFMRWISGNLQSGWSVIASVVIYVMGGILLWWFWTKEVGEWHRRHLTNTTIEGD